MNEKDKQEQTKSSLLQKQPFNTTKDLFNCILSIAKPSLSIVIEDYNFTAKDIKILLGRDWLNDKIINIYFALLSKKFTKVYAFTSYFYYFLNKKGYQEVAKWTKNTNLFAYDVILIPVHLENHWILVVINIKDKSVEYYDSLGGYNCTVMKKVTEFIELEQAKWCKYPKTFLRYKKKVSLQDNGYDCGVYVCMYARTCVDNKQQYKGSMKHLRLKILHEILANTIVYDLSHTFSPSVD